MTTDTPNHDEALRDGYGLDAAAWRRLADDSYRGMALRLVEVLDRFEWVGRDTSWSLSERAGLLHLTSHDTRRAREHKNPGTTGPMHITVVVPGDAALAVRDHIHSVVCREVDEVLKFDGVAVFDPH